MRNPVMEALVGARLNEQNQRDTDIAAAVFQALGAAPAAGKLPQTFVDFCRTWNVSPMPARPAAVAAFVLQFGRFGADVLAEDLAAISAVHVAANQGDPTQGFPVTAAVARVAEIEPPRSWTVVERKRFAALPLPTQQYVLQRESERDSALQRALQKVADERKQLKAAAENVCQTEQTKPETKTEEKTTNVETENAGAAG
jgi:hypothetical protein